jgi:hypothetical protein
VYSELVHTLCGRPKRIRTTSGQVPGLDNLVTVPYIRVAVNHVPSTLKKY